MRYISDLHEGDQVSEIYLCKTKSPGTSKFGKSYYSLTLQDKTGMTPEQVAKRMDVPMKFVNACMR